MITIIKSAHIKTSSYQTVKEINRKQVEEKNRMRFDLWR